MTPTHTLKQADIRLKQAKRESPSRDDERHRNVLKENGKQKRHHQKDPHDVRYGQLSRKTEQHSL